MPSRRLSRHRGPVYLAITVSGSVSHAPLLRGTTPVMWYRSDVRDARDLESRVVQRTHRRFPSGSRSLHHHFQILQTVLRRRLAGLHRRDLRRKRSTLSRSLESARPCGRPCERIALTVGDRDHGIVERGMYMGNTVADGATDLLLRSRLRLGHRRVPVLSLDGPARALSGASVGVGALAPHRQSPAMANPPVTPEIHQPLDAHRNLPAQIAFGHPLGNLSAECIKLCVSQVSDGHLRTNPGRTAYLERTGSTDPVDVRQGHPHVFPIGDVDSSNTCHNGQSSLPGQARKRIRPRVTQPCLCLCRASLQMTRTAPLRRITLQFRHSRLTDARTFIRILLVASSWYTRAPIPFQVGLLQQSLILVRHQMRLHL